MSLTLERPTPAASAGTLALQVGDRVRARRKQRGWTLLQLAQAIGTTPQTVQRLETANMTMSMEWAEKFCSALDCDSDELFGRPSEISMLRDVVRAMRREAEVLQLRAQQFIGEIDELLIKCSAVEEAIPPNRL